MTSSRHRSMVSPAVALAVLLATVLGGCITAFPSRAPIGRVVFVGAQDCVGAPYPQILDVEHFSSENAWGLPDPVGGSATLLKDGRNLAAGGGPACPDDADPRGQTSDAYLLDPTRFPGLVP